MSTTTTGHPAQHPLRPEARDARAPGTASGALTWRRVARSEWLKFTTLRSTWAVLATAVATMLAFSIVFGYHARHLAGLAPEDSAPSAVLQGYYLAQLLLTSLGVVFVSGEYATGGIRSTFTAVPRRLPVLAAKTVVLAATVLVTMLAATVVAFLLGRAVIAHHRPAAALTDPGVPRVVIGTAVYLAAVTLIGSAIGWLVRSTPGALVTAAGLILVLPGLASTVLGEAGEHVAALLPVGAGSTFASSAPPPASLTPLAGLIVLLSWVVALLALAAIRLRHRDA